MLQIGKEKPPEVPGGKGRGERKKRA